MVIGIVIGLLSSVVLGVMVVVWCLLKVMLCRLLVVIVVCLEFGLVRVVWLIWIGCFL